MHWLLLILPLLPLAGLIQCIRHLILARSSTKWPSVEGTLLECSVTSRRSDNKRTVHQAKVRYKYQVAGREYQSTVKSYRMDISADEFFAMEHPAGSTIRVFHHPAKPMLATLETGDSFNNYLTIFGVSVAFIVMLAITLKLIEEF